MCTQQNARPTPRALEFSTFTYMKPAYVNLNTNDINDNVMYVTRENTIEEEEEEE